MNKEDKVYKQMEKYYEDLINKSLVTSVFWDCNSGGFEKFIEHCCDLEEIESDNKYIYSIIEEYLDGSINLISEEYKYFAEQLNKQDTNQKYKAIGMNLYKAIEGDIYYKLSMKKIIMLLENSDFLYNFSESSI